MGLCLSCIAQVLHDRLLNIDREKPRCSTEDVDISLLSCQEQNHTHKLVNLLVANGEHLPELHIKQNPSTASNLQVQCDNAA